MGLACHRQNASCSGWLNSYKVRYQLSTGHHKRTKRWPRQLPPSNWMWTVPTVNVCGFASNGFMNSHTGQLVSGHKLLTHTSVSYHPSLQQIFYTHTINDLSWSIEWTHHKFFEKHIIIGAVADPLKVIEKSPQAVFERSHDFPQIDQSTNTTKHFSGSICAAQLSNFNTILWSIFFLIALMMSLRTWII